MACNNFRLHSLAIIIAHCTIAVAQTCTCKDLRNKFAVTRLWNIVDPRWTSDEVIREFQKGYAPQVTAMEGFEEYLSANTGDDSTVFFMNIFSSEEKALETTQGAQDYMASSVLNGAIEPNYFSESYMVFHYSSQDCAQESMQGKYLSSRIYKITGNLTAEEIVTDVEENFAPAVQTYDGFYEYGASASPDKTHLFFYNIFDDQQGAIAANNAAAAYVESSILNGQWDRIMATQGVIGFDYTCASTGATAQARVADDSSTSAARFFGTSMLIVLAMGLSAYISY